MSSKILDSLSSQSKKTFQRLKFSVKWKNSFLEDRMEPAFLHRVSSFLRTQLCTERKREKEKEREREQSIQCSRLSRPTASFFSRIFTRIQSSMQFTSLCTLRGRIFQRTSSPRPEALCYVTRLLVV